MGHLIQRESIREQEWHIRQLVRGDELFTFPYDWRAPERAEDIILRGHLSAAKASMVRSGAGHWHPARQVM